MGDNETQGNQITKEREKKRRCVSNNEDNYWEITSSNLPLLKIDQIILYCQPLEDVVAPHAPASTS